MLANTSQCRVNHLPPQVIELHLSPHCRESISLQAIKTAHKLAVTIESAPEQLSLAGAELLRQQLPAEVLQALTQFSKPSSLSVLVLKQLVSLAAPDTPTSGFIDDKLMAAHDLVLGGAMNLAGSKPTAFTFENSGRIGRNVVSNPDQRGKASSHGFDVDLFWHQDNCGQPFEGEQLPGCKLPPMPKHLAFVGIRNNERVPTRILLVDDALRGLQRSTISILSGPNYRIGAPDSVAADGFESTCVEDAAILREEASFRLLRYDPFLVSTKDPAALLAHARLAVALEEATPAAIDIMIDAGDVVIFKNYRVLHMRVAFQPYHAADSRWLRRFYGSSTR
jgi:hypothetical protein